MKKVFSLLAVCVLLVGMMACVGMSASAATPKEEIVAAAKVATPDAYENAYLPALENVLAQIDVTAEQAEAVIANIDAVKAVIKEDKGISLDAYTRAEIDVVLKNFGEACATLGLTYKLVDAEVPEHPGDSACEIYKVDGARIAVINNEVVKTDAPESNMAMVMALALALAFAGVAAIYGKKLVASR